VKYFSKSNKNAQKEYCMFGENILQWQVLKQEEIEK
jgi:hypothetical protein